MKHGWKRLIALCAAGILMLSSAMADKVFTFTFTGDVTLGGEEQKKNDPNSFYGYVEREGYDYFFQNYREMFEKDDLTLINLEGTLTDSASQEKKSKTYRFRAPTDFVNILTRSSIEACNISNNHMMDFDKQGYESTLATLDAAGVKYCGYQHYFIFEKEGIKIAFFGLVSPKVAGMRVQIRDMIARLKEEEHINAVVFTYHMGSEYSKIRNKTQETYAKIALNDFQADLVIMHHPHVLEGIDIMENRYVCYSLGNFCFGGNLTVRALPTMVVQADMVFTDDGEYKGQQLRLYPAHISTVAEKKGDANDFLPKPVTGDEAMEVFGLVQYDTKFELGLYDEDAGCIALPYLPAQAEEAVEETTEKTTEEAKPEEKK